MYHTYYPPLFICHKRANRSTPPLGRYIYSTQPGPLPFPPRCFLTPRSDLRSKVTVLSINLNSVPPSPDPPCYTPSVCESSRSSHFIHYDLVNNKLFVSDVCTTRTCMTRKSDRRSEPGGYVNTHRSTGNDDYIRIKAFAVKVDCSGNKTRDTLT